MQSSQYDNNNENDNEEQDKDQGQDQEQEEGQDNEEYEQEEEEEQNAKTVFDNLKEENNPQSKNQTHQSTKFYDRNAYNEEDSKLKKPASNNANNPLSTQAYLESTVMTALSEGMFQVSQQKPSNPIEFLGKYLIEKSKMNKKGSKK